MDMYQTTYMRDYGEKRDIPKPTSPKEQKFITDILHNEQTGMYFIHSKQIIKFQYGTNDKKL